MKKNFRKRLKQIESKQNDKSFWITFLMLFSLVTSFILTITYENFAFLLLGVIIFLFGSTTGILLVDLSDLEEEKERLWKENK